MTDDKIKLEFKKPVTSASDMVCHRHNETTKYGNTVEVVRFLDGEFGISFTKMVETAEIRTRIRLSEAAINALVVGHAAIKDKPLEMTWEYLVVKKKEVKQKRQQTKPRTRKQSKPLTK